VFPSLSRRRAIFSSAACHQKRSGDTLPNTRIIHEGFYCNRRYAAATSLTAGGLAARSVNILFKYASLPRGSVRPSRLASRRFRPEPP
jgi:hypothetical protein